MFDAMDRYLGHRPKITPPVLINRGTEFEDDTSIHRSETDEQATPCSRGQEGEDDPHLSGVRHRSGKKKRRSMGADNGELVREVIGTLETRWEREEQRDDAKAATEREDNNRFYGILSSIANSLEKLTDK